MSQRHLLVVDDEPINLEIISEFLEGAGYTLDLVDSADVAWERLRSEGAAYSLAILDRMMPGLDGMELMRRMKADPRLQHMPVIMQTAAVAPEQIAEGIAAGAFFYLTKPYAGEALLGIVKAALESVETGEQLRALMQHEALCAKLLQRASFECVGLDDVQACTSMIAGMCPDPATAAIGIKELLVNGVEHGNLAITYAEKKALKLSDRWEEEVERRGALPENRGKTVRVELARTPGTIELTIVDQGAGFDWRKYLELDHRRAFDPNGRGIAMARMLSFARLEYRGCGNEVHATIRA